MKIANVNRASVAGIGLKTVFKILDKWGCTADQIQSILQISKSSYYKYQKQPEKASLTQDQLERLSYLLNIHAYLRVLFDNPENVYGFMSMQNHNPYFDGRSPLEVISSGRIVDLYETCKRVEALILV